MQTAQSPHAYPLASKLSLTRVLLQTSAFCTVISLAIWQLVPAIGQYGFWSNFVHSQAIGLCTASMTVAVSMWAGHSGAKSRLVWFVVLSLISLIGLLLGLTIAAWLLGIPVDFYANPFRDVTTHTVAD